MAEFYEDIRKVALEQMQNAHWSVAVVLALLYIGDALREILLEIKHGW